MLVSAAVMGVFTLAGVVTPWLLLLLTFILGLGSAINGPALQIRRRDGAIRWGLFRDPAESGRFVESFLVETWVKHLRQHVRGTESDREIEERILAFHIGGGQPAVTHLIAEHVPR
jgi:hypothetical protein